MSSWCKKCKLKYQKRYNTDNQSMISQYKKNYYKENDEVYKVRQVNWRKNNTDYYLKYFSDYQKTEKGKIKFRVHGHNRRAMQAALRHDFNEENYAYIANYFGHACALTESEDIQLEHFIPISWGHGGNYLGNLYFLDASLNQIKKDINPFEWIKQERVKTVVIMKKWRELINWLANQNGLDKNQFEQFVYWCELNKRTIQEVENEEIDSLELFKTKYLMNV